MNLPPQTPSQPPTRSDRLNTVGRDFCAWLHMHRGARAELRRCGSVGAIALTPAFHHLRTLLHASEVRMSGFEWAAVAAGVLAQLDQELVSTDIVQAMAKAPKGGRAPVSGLRFRRLLAAEEPDVLLTHLRRAVRLVDGVADAGSILRAIDAWRSDWLRMTWAERYYTHAPKDEA